MPRPDRVQAGEHGDAEYAIGPTSFSFLPPIRSV
jgi:hypothetical protein